MVPDGAGFTVRIHKAFVSALSQSGATAKDVSDEYFCCYGVASSENAWRQRAQSADRENRQ
jgi:hypothetical protein